MIHPSFTRTKKLPLRLILIVPFVLQIFAAVGLVGYLSFRNGQKAVNDLAEQLMSQASKQVDRQLDNYLAMPHKINQINSNAVQVGLLKLHDFKNTGHYFWQQMQVFDVSYIYYALVTGEYAGAGRFRENRGVTIDELSLNTKGKTYTYQTDRQGDRTSVIDVQDYTPLTDPWYTKTLKANKPIWSSVYNWSDLPEFLSIGATRPIYDNTNKFIGVMGVDFLLSNIGDFLGSIKISPSAKIFIIERNGLLIANSISQKPFTMVNGKAQRLNVLNSSDSLIQNTAKYLQQKFGNFQAIKNGKQLDFEFQNSRQFVQVTPWRDEYGLDWLVIVVVPESDFMAQINANTRTTILLCLGALGGAIALGIFTSRWITKPIVQLRTASVAIASGELDQTVEVKGIDELETLAAAFNQMATQLKESFLELETKVEERTAQLKEAKESADSANNAKSEFLANMSHELRTPLNGILGYAQILQRDQTANPKQKDGINIIHQCASHLLTLINDILDLSKIEARKLELSPHDFHFASFLNGIVEICRIKAEQKEIAFNYEVLNKLPTAIHADEKRLRQVLINLLGNAIKFTDKGGVTFKIGVIDNQSSVIVNSKNDPFPPSGFASRSWGRPPRPRWLTIPHSQFPIPRIRFQIEDTGVGMNSEQLQKIFLPFVQVGDKQRMAEGTGLGLAISQQIVQMMQSELQVESLSNVGSKFWFDVDLPESNQWIELNNANTHNIIGYEQEKQKILLVDDRWENRSVIVNLLEPLGFELMEAVNGEEGLEKAKTWHPNLIITDLVMPVLSGLEMTESLRNLSEFKDVIIIASSASVFNFDRQQSLKSGCNDFLPKPVQSKELLEKISQHMKLSWIYEAGIVPLTENALVDTAAAFIAPSAEELQALYIAAQIGDIAGVEQEALRLQQLDSQYLPFTAKLLQLAQEMDEEGIFKLIKQYT
ncbi:response regulator [Hassallia byssoidea VB512170]|uniref:histidine kinase n=1 Tax=Hassallia byssoidea VB512170 TaxID=1304833 RepID=A0A846H871_9CYAN|nr:hybrid sensor histidine kinase/response regulator [Hassalia byssoidea]NEU73485.1 response regulator [Hassalia byssoidea VB512170]